MANVDVDGIVRGCPVSPLHGACLVTAVKVYPVNGDKCPVTNLKDGNGVCVWYHKNGQKEREQNFKDGKQDGLWIFYNEDGTEKGRQDTSGK